MLNHEMLKIWMILFHQSVVSLSLEIVILKCEIPLLDQKTVFSQSHLMIQTIGRFLFDEKTVSSLSKMKKLKVGTPVLE